MLGIGIVSGILCNHDSMQSHNTEAKCYIMRSELELSQLYSVVSFRENLSQY